MTDLLTSSEARALLGNMSPSSFKNLVDGKKIRKVTAPGKTQGKYVAEDVQKLAEELKPFLEAEKTVGKPARIEAVIKIIPVIRLLLIGQEIAIFPTCSPMTMKCTVWRTQ